MFTIYAYMKNRRELYPVSSEWAANLIAYKYVKNWGWDEAYVVDVSTGEILKTYKKA